MILETLVLFIEFTVQTVFLFAALWIMIKIQKLDYHFLGLLGTAALVSAVDRALDAILGHFLGIYLANYISTPIVGALLFVCVSMVTHADRVDVMFTIVVGYALMFGMNLWLFGALLGDLRPSAGNARDFDTTPQEPETNEVYRAPLRTNQSTASAPAGLPAQPRPVPPLVAGTNLFSVKGITQNGSNSAVTIQTGKRTYTISLGESALTQTPKGPVSVRFKELGDGWVVLTINGEETRLPFH